MRVETLLVVALFAALSCSSESDTPDGSSGGSAGASSAAGGSAGASSGGSVSSGGASAGSGGTGSAGTPGGGASGASGGSAGSAGAQGGGAGSGGVAGSAGSAGAAGAGGGAPLGPVTVYIAGDSTVSTYTDTASTTDQAGWGQMLHESFSELVTIENRAIGGRTSRRFIDEGRLDEILAEIEPGDYFLVQFGTNDSNNNPSASYELNGQTIPYYLEPNGAFKEYLMQYVEGARSKQATPILVTPPPRNSAYCTGGNGTGAYAQAMRDLGEAENVTVADLNQKAVDHLKAICPAPTPEDVFLLRGDGSVDGTHFQENGARLLAGFVAEGIDESGVGLASYLK